MALASHVRDLSQPKPQRVDPIFGGRSADELEFLPAALEVVETPAPPIARIVGLTMTAALVLAIGWACVGKVDIVATASGKLVPTGGAKVIQPLETGTVTAIYAHEGQFVHKGDTLVALDGTQARTDRDRVKEELDAAQLEVARLQTVALGRPFGAGAASDPVATQLALREAAAERDELSEKLAMLDREVAEHKAEIVEAKAQEGRLQALLPPERRVLDAYEQLDAKQLVPLNVLVDAQTKLADTSHQLEVQRAKIPELVEQIATIEHQRAETSAETSKTDLDNLTQAEVKVATLQKQLEAAEQHLQTRTLVAPADGTIQEVAVHTIGGVVEPGEALMHLAPAQATLEVEAKLPNKDIGFVRVGMPAAAKVEAFPFTKYGVLRGTVLSVSNDASTEKRPDGTESLTYLVRLKLDRNAVNIDGHEVRLDPGMAITAEIMTGRRRVIEYVLSPLSKTLGEAGRER